MLPTTLRASSGRSAWQANLHYERHRGVCPAKLRTKGGAKWGYTVHMYYVYILLLKNRQHYIGFTKDLRKRLLRHHRHSSPTTSRIPPEELVFYAAFCSKTKALDFERYLKSSSGFAFRNKRLV